MANYGSVDLIVYALKVEIHIHPGMQNERIVSIAQDDISRYAPNATMSTQCIPLGSAAATAYSLTFDNQEYRLKAADLNGAKVHAYISEGVHDENWRDFGVWYADDVIISEQDPFCTISGADALGCKFDDVWTDTKEDYPRTLLLIAKTMCAIAGVRLATENFHNAGYGLAKMPEWGENTTIRDVISYIAVCAAGFARINYSGELEIITIGAGAVHTAGPDYYSTYAAGGEFRFNCLQYRFETDDEEKEEEYTRFAIDGTLKDDATNTIQMERNPLITEEMANDIAQTLTGLEYEGATITWFGGAEVLPGDELIITTTDGTNHRLILNSYSMDIGGGMTSNATCDMPSALSQTEFFSNGANAFNPDGTINANAIPGLDKKVVSAATGYFTNLTADNAHFSKLLAGIIQATEFWAKSIQTDEVKTDSLTAAVGAIIQATINKLDAGTIETDTIYAGIAELIAIKAGKLTAESITTDRLAAALVAFTVLTAGTAEFDQATIAHLVSQAMNLSFGTAGDVFIDNLRVKYAQIVSATIGNLVIKASNGNYYEIDVDDNGNVSAELTTVTDGETEAGQTSAGKVILATDIAAESLNTTNLLATYALINKIDAAKIDVDSLFAREAFIGALTTKKIFSDTSIEMVIGAQNEMSRWFRFDDQEGFTIRKPAWTDENGTEHPESIWQFTAKETGIQIRRSDMPAEPILQAERDRISAPKIQAGQALIKGTSTGGIVIQCARPI